LRYVDIGLSPWARCGRRRLVGGGYLGGGIGNDRRMSVTEADSEHDDRNSLCVFAPSPLVTVTVEHDVHESDQLHVHVGGQGLWIARMVRTLGMRPQLCAAFGGETGQVAGFLAELEDLDVRHIPTESWNGGYVHDRRGGDRVELVDVPPSTLSRHELDELYSVTMASALSTGTCILAGSHIKEVIPDDVYGRLASDLGSAGVEVIADLSGSSLRAVLEGAPSLVKVSDEELERDGWADSRELDDVLRAIERLREAGARAAVVSRGAETTLASIHGLLFEVGTPSVVVVDGRGGGDSITGALGVATAKAMHTLDGLRLAAAAGAATIVRRGLATGAADVIEAMAPLVDVVALDDTTRDAIAADRVGRFGR
jgi:1-phosphofructokinase